MRSRILVLTLTLSFVLFAAEPSPQRFADIGDLPLVSGGILQKARIGYRSYGQLNTEKSNAILFPTWFTGESKDLAGFVGPDRWLNPAKYFIITVDALANGVSTSPSNSASQPGEAFPAIAIADMVESQRRLIEQEFGITRLHAVMGISMGGMQTFEWLVHKSALLGRAVPIVGSPQLTSFDKLLWSTQREVIDDALRSKATAGQLEDAMRTVRLIHELHLRTAEWRVRNTDSASFPAYLSSLMAQKAEMNPVDYLRQLEAMIGHDVARGAGSLSAAAEALQKPTLAIVDLEDEMVRPEPALGFAASPRLTLLPLRTGCGHMATSCADTVIANAVAGFLAREIP